MRGVHAHAHRDHTRLARPDELLPDEANDPSVDVPLENAEVPSRSEPHDELNAVRGILLGCVIGASLWLLIALLAAWVL